MRLSCCLLNAENLFLLHDEHVDHISENLSEEEWQRYSAAVIKNKPLKKLRQLQSEFEILNPDLIMLVEVGGRESLHNFNRLFLGDRYQELLIEGNSDRFIDVGFLLRKSLPFRGELVTNKNRKIDYLYDHEEMSVKTGYEDLAPRGGSHRFSRDACELHLFDTTDQKTKAVFVLTHLKSKLDPEGIDPDGKERRKAELETLLTIYEDLKSQYDDKIPIFLCGDFNGNATRNATDEEFSSIYSKTDLEDIFELAGLDEDERATFYNVRPRLTVFKLQLDYVFISKTFAHLVDLESVRVYPYKDLNGFDLPVPLTIDQKSVFPSDHNPIVFDIKI